MSRYDAGTTNPTLLIRLGDWREHEARFDFVTRYDPVIRSASSRYLLDTETTEEFCEQVSIDLTRRSVSRHDTSESFTSRPTEAVPR
jgi:hypothetical protein